MAADVHIIHMPIINYYECLSVSISVSMCVNSVELLLCIYNNKTRQQKKKTVYVIFRLSSCFWYLMAPPIFMEPLWLRHQRMSRPRSSCKITPIIKPKKNSAMAIPMTAPVEMPSEVGVHGLSWHCGWDMLGPRPIT